jgi:ribosomal protein S18 acetylase RimI-like enzyme
VLDFIQMSQEGYELWRQTSIAGYAEENIVSGRWTGREAHAKSEQEFNKLLPYGLATPDNYLYSLVEDQRSEPVGMIWFALVREDGGREQAFIYDFQILEAYRRRGYGTQALLRLEDRVMAMGMKAISLHVFAHNRAARNLYGKVGYRETNIIMSKELD